jgi:pimeloyl-ACP methyl ester carboxylesterase
VPTVIPNHGKPQTLLQSLGEVDLSYLYYEGNEDAIIFLHATGFMPWLWHPIARNLTPHYRIIAPYFCDHRETDPERGGLNWMTLAHDLSIFCKRLEIKNPLLVGHSMGATVLTLAEAAYGLGAEGMILIEPIFLPQDFYRIKLKVEDHPLASKSIRRRNSWNSESEAIEYLRSRPLFAKWNDEMLKLYIQYGMAAGETGGLQLTCGPIKEASLFMGGMGYDPWPLLSKISCPVLILEGELSENRSYIDLVKATSMFSRGSHRIVKDAGHLIPMEQPEVITGIIRDFFKGLIIKDNKIPE